MTTMPMVRLSFDDVVRELSRVLQSVAFTPDKARRSATLFAETHQDGVTSHGLNRFPRFVRQIKAGIYQKLDKSKLPNYKNLDADISKKLEVFDPANEYSVNYMWGTSGVAYNEEAIKQAMPDAPVDSFAMFWDPKVVSKFAKCGVSVLDAPSEVVGTVLIYLGKDANSMRYLKYFRATEKLREQDAVKV